MERTTGQMSLQEPGRHAPDNMLAGADGFSYRWRWRRTRYGPLDPAVAARAGEPCRVFARGRDGKVGVEFADGLQLVAPRWAVRRITGGEAAR